MDDFNAKIDNENAGLKRAMLKTWVWQNELKKAEASGLLSWLWPCDRKDSISAQGHPQINEVSWW